MVSDMPESHVRIGEAARRLGVSADTVREWEAKGVIRATRTPTGQRLFSTEEIDRLLSDDGGKVTA